MKITEDMKNRFSTDVVVTKILEEESPWVKCVDGLPVDGQVCVIIVVTNSLRYSEIASYDALSNGFLYWDYCCDNINVYEPIKEVLAWMPIPEFSE